MVFGRREFVGVPHDADFVFCAEHLLGAGKGGLSSALTMLATHKAMRVDRKSILDFVD